VVDPKILAHLMDRRHLYHAPREGEPVTVEQTLSRGAVIITDMPAWRCPTCGTVYVDNFYRL
jgi:YgiT-type zinc finger domain-containing protein